MSAEVVQLADARRRRALPPRDRSRPQAEVRGSLVLMLATDQDTAHTPAATRVWANRLLALADRAEGRPGSALGEAELRERLVLLGEAVARLDGGRGGVSTVVDLARQLTAEVRRG